MLACSESTFGLNFGITVLSLLASFPVIKDLCFGPVENSGRRGSPDSSFKDLKLFFFLYLLQQCWLVAFLGIVFSPLLQT